MEHQRILPWLIIIANILLFPYSTSPTPPDAHEIAMLSGRGDRMRAYIGVCFIRDWKGGGKEGAGVGVDGKSGKESEHYSCSYCNLHQEIGIGEHEMKIYMDVCCLCRPFDDQTMGRIRLEVTAVQEIIRRCATGESTMVSSEAITEELSKIPDTKKQLRVEKIVSVAKEYILID